MLSRRKPKAASIFMLLQIYELIKKYILVEELLIWDYLISIQLTFCKFPYGSASIIFPLEICCIIIFHVSLP